jgi:hypothetical protein
MFRYRRSLLALALAVATTLSLTATTAAAAPERAPDPAVAAALGRVAAGMSSTADLALIRSEPELAKLVADPSRTTVTRKQSLKAGPPSDAGTSGVEICGNWIEVTVTQYTVLGFVLFQWRHHAGFCIDYQVGLVTRWEDRWDGMLYADPTVDVLERTADSATPLPGSPGASHMQRHLKQCILTYGCYANWYPWATAAIWGDGRWGYDGGAG